MSFIELEEKRYTVRTYSTNPVEAEKLQLILEAGRNAPSAMNFQPQKVYVLKSEEAMQKLRNVTRMAYNAPMALLICYDSNISWKNTPDTFGEHYDGGEIDACIVTSMMMMEAADLGLGSLWVRGYNSQVIADTFDLPDHIRPVCILLLGYPGEGIALKHSSKKPLSETVIEL